MALHYLILKAALLVAVWSSQVSQTEGFITRTRGTESQALGSVSHQAMTQNAVYLATARLFNAMPSGPSAAVIPESRVLLPETMFELFYGRPVSTTDYVKAIDEIVRANAAVDANRDTVDNPVWHFDNEQLPQSDALLRRLWDTIYQSVMAEPPRYTEARSFVGQYLHVLQEFYSHSNWVEMGMTVPHDGLGVAGSTIGDVADAARATCSNCPFSVSTTSYFCERNILSNLAEQRVLTSGYHSVKKAGATSTTKPPGKCSHGGLPTHPY